MKNVLFALVASTLTVCATSAETLLERGAYLVNGPMACGNCHTPKGPDGPIADLELAGGFVITTPAFEAHVPNITPGSRIADWSDADLAKAIREGVRPDGSVIRPPMAIEFYRSISDSDINAVIAYLRSVPSKSHSVPESTYNIPVPETYGPPLSAVADLPREVSATYGEYLVTVAHCMECHTPMGQGSDVYRTDLGRGGREFEGPWGVSTSSNLTNGPDGLADYSDADVKRMITEGVRPDGSPMQPPMPYRYFATIDPDDLDAIVMYLRTLPSLPDNR